MQKLADAHHGHSQESEEFVKVHLSTEEWTAGLYQIYKVGNQLTPFLM